MRLDSAKRIVSRRNLGHAVSFTLLLAAVGVVFRSYLGQFLNANIRDNLDREWIAMKAFLQIQDGKFTWLFDREDPDQNFVVRRLRRGYLLTDARGSVLQSSDIYTSLEEDTPDEVRAAIASRGGAWKIKKDPQGATFLIRSGAVYSKDKNHDPYFAAIGRSLAENEKLLRQFTQVYFGLIPIMVFGGCLLGSLIGGRNVADAEE